ncbi:MAG: DUF2868 domain-containing protein [Planctomycetes bacterium]|nr:DUF2868 domain-containing protein [Planctomycetota bacterium]
MSGLGLAELFDLESLVLKEEAEAQEVRRTRYRTLGRRALDQGRPADDPAALLKTLVRSDGSPTPGSRFEAGLIGFQRLLALAGLISGGAVSLGLLHYAGDHPVNVLNVLAGLVGVQIVLLLLLLIALVPRERRTTPGPFQELLLRGLRRLLPESDRDLLKTLSGRLDAHQGLIRWLLVRSAQIFGVAFNLAAIAGCLYRVAFSDVAFGWSTTLRFDAASFRGLAETLSVPWAWLFPRGVPTQQLVESTQYSHLEGKYLLSAAGARSVDPSVVGGWWPFLLLSIGSYGLLPRLIVLAFSGLRVRRILRETPMRNEEFRRLVDWMKLPVVTTLAEGSAPAPPLPAGAGSDPEPELPPPGSSCELLLDGAPPLRREDLDRMIRDRFGWTVSPTPDGPLLVLISAWEEPTKGNQRRFQNLPRGRLVVVGLLNPSPGGANDPRLPRIRDRWKRHLQTARRDLRLRVEALG